MLKTYKYRNPKFFWDRFSQHEAKLYEFNDHSVPMACIKLYKILQLYNPNIGFELSPKLINGKREMLLTANGDDSLFDVVAQLVDSAPKHLQDKWHFICLRPPSDVEDVIINFEGKEISSKDILYDLVPSLFEKGKFDILLHIKGIRFETPGIEDDVCETAFIIIEGIIGEKMLGRNLSTIILADESDMKSPKTIMKLKNEKWPNR